MRVLFFFVDQSRCGGFIVQGTIDMNFLVLPSHVDVAHFLPADADIIQDDVAGVPDDAAQEEPEEEPKHLILNTCCGWVVGWLTD